MKKFERYVYQGKDLIKFIQDNNAEEMPIKIEFWEDGDYIRDDFIDKAYVDDTAFDDTKVVVLCGCDGEIPDFLRFLEEE